MPAFTLEGFESPEEVQARIGKAKETAFRPQGDINSLIYQTAAQGAAGLGGAAATALGYEDPEVKMAKSIQEMMKDLDPSTSKGLYEGSSRLYEAGHTAAAADVAKKALETRKVEQALLASKNNQGRSSYHVLKDVMLPTGEVDKDGAPILANYKVGFNARTGKLDTENKVLSPKDASVQGDVSFAKKAGNVKGGDQTQAGIDLPKAQGDAEYLKKTLDELITHDGFETSVGMGFGFMSKFAPATDAAAWQARFKQIEGKKFMTAYRDLKGGGQITEIEGVKATEAESRMKAATSEEEFIDAVDDYKKEIDRAVSIMERRAGMSKSEVKEDQLFTEANIIMEQARAAIARGAPRDKVMSKLIKGFKKKGYDVNLIGGL